MTKTGESQSILEELSIIRRLLVFALLRSGASQAEVAGALGVNQSSISRMFPKATMTRRKRT